MQSLLLRCFVLACALTGGTTARAQSAHWEPAAGTLAFNQESQVQLVFEDCKPDGDITLPKVDNISTTSYGQQSQTTFTNGHLSSSFVQIYGIRPSTRNPVDLPAFQVATNKGPITVPAAHFDIGDATVGQSNLALDKVAVARFSAPISVWAGEVFPLNYTLSVVRRYFYQANPTIQWSPGSLIVEEWSKPDVAEIAAGTDSKINVAYKTRAYAKAPDTLTITAANQTVLLVTGSSPFGLFNRPNYEPYVITSNRPSIIVRPLPEHAPASFAGAVGKFEFTSKIVPDSVTVGEPITWTLSIEGTGNWPEIAGLPSREVSKDFRVVQPVAKRTPKDNSMFDATLSEDVVLIPTKPGNYTLGPISWTYFDSGKGEYQTVTSPAKTISVTAPIATTPNGAEQPNPTPAASSQPTHRDEPKPAPAAPAPIPRDPSSAHSQAVQPLPGGAVAKWAALPWAGVLLLWLGLALRRARRTDPLRPRREAHQRIGETVTAIEATKDRGQLERLLQSWQRDAAILFQVNRAVPVADQIGSKEEPLWSELWRESEHFLYGPDAELAPQWTQRARTAWSQHRVPSFSPWQLIYPRNLLPFAAMIVLACCCAVPPSWGDEATAAYGRGDFSAAEQGWRQAAQVDPASWTLRYNLSLALAQQDRWDEATAHAAAAFVQAPVAPENRWNLSLVASKATYVPAILGDFNHPTPLHRLARNFSPAEWQYGLVLASTLGALALAGALIYGYGLNSKVLLVAILLAVMSAGLVGVASALSLHVYGITGRSNAVLVWHTATLRSIPTEADTTQKTSPVSPGTVAQVGKSFLGWRQLSFGNGQTGWVRSEDLIPLWH